MAGYDDQEPTSLRAHDADYIKGLHVPTKSFRIGLPKNVFYEDVDAEIEAAVSEAVGVFRKLVADIRDIHLPRLSNASTVFAEVSALHGERFEKTPEAFHPAIRVNLERAVKVSAAEYIRNRRELDQLRRNTEALFPDVDFLITPTVERAAPTITDVLTREPWGSNRNVGPFNKYGLPAISIPCGFSRSSVPIGVQIIGKPFREARLLALARAYERATPWHSRRPVL
jgi:aspartyl-tRNA(Asn)/glutamyl-tRNA(Gln) amidotransferase subunit A